MRHNRLQTSRKGQAAVEFMLSAAFLLCLVFGIFALSFGGYQWAIIQNAVNDAARWGSQQAATGVTPRETVIELRLKAVLAQYGMDSTGITIDFPPFSADGATGVGGASSANHFYRLRATTTLQFIEPFNHLLALFTDGTTTGIPITAESLIRNEPFG